MPPKCVLLCFVVKVRVVRERQKRRADSVYLFYYSLPAREKPLFREKIQNKTRGIQGSSPSCENYARERHNL